MRFIAFLMVFAAHVLPHDAAGFSGLPFAGFFATSVRAGGFGVDLFFALSAFLITQLLKREIDRTGRLDVRAFYIRRALRIWPLYFGFLLIGYALQFTRLGEPLAPADLGAFAIFLGNWRIAILGYPAATFALLWSLCMEEQFYLLWAPAMKLTRAASLNRIALGMIAISILARVVFSWFNLPDYSFWCATITRLDPIAVGILAANGWRPPLAKTPAIAIALGFAAIFPAEGVDPAFPQYGRVVGYAVAALGCALVLTGALAVNLQAGVLSYLGKISFGLYVFHRAIVDALIHGMAAASHGMQVARLLLSLVLTIIAASISYRLYETPFLKLKGRFEHIRSRPV